MKMRLKEWMFGLVLSMFVLTLHATTTNIYVWCGSAGDGDWFNAANWSLTVDGTPIDPPEVPGSRYLTDGTANVGVYIVAASNVTGTINYTPPPGAFLTNTFLSIEKSASDLTPLTFNVNGGLERKLGTDRSWPNKNPYSYIGNGGDLTFNIQSGFYRDEFTPKINCTAFNVAQGAEFCAFYTAPWSNLTLVFEGKKLTIQGWFGTLGEDYDTTDRHNALVSYGEVIVDGGTLFPDYLNCSTRSTLSITNGGVMRTRYGCKSGVAMAGNTTATYTNQIDLADGTVSNVCSLLVAGANEKGVAYGGLSVVTVRGGNWFQGGVTCIGNGRVGRLVCEGGLFATPSDLHVGGGRDGSPDTDAPTCAFNGELTVTGGTVTVCNPDAGTLYKVDGTLLLNGSRVCFDRSPWSGAYQGQRVIFDSLRSGGTGVDTQMIYWANYTEVGGYNGKKRFALMTTPRFTKQSYVTGTAYNSGTGSNMYYTLPARLLVGNWMTFKTGTLLNTGTLNLASGSLTADELIATNGTASILSFAGGTLTVKQFTDINNGVATVFGDGESSALLELVAGTHHFADGLVITNNATLAIGGTNAIGSVGLMGGLAFARGAALDVDFSAATNDWLEVGGAVALADEVTLTLAHVGDDTARSPVTILKASEGIEGSAGAWPSATVNNIKYRAVVAGDELRLEKVAQGTMVNIL